ncbi:putative glycerophosphodiester phosphodiesterase [Hibiscus syriacus]|uniref:Glycerophosphodiester phosphodiesterase n=1 Tax=Hibiscus syriacus TaxID=106335 RepID=A0A6A3AWA4_HIBSY|nr:NAC domain-containing protein 83-like [Hibiscus syriacus]KAE8707162.1 putative glycerophosphodiester phosphodiesterase [Hibiscus syriacus]
MEAQNFAVNGGVKMPIGYRFHPTDEELVVHYLKRKALNLPLPSSVIPELDVLQTDPWSLPGDVKENKYFFSKRYGNDSNNKRKSCGYWKAIGKEKPILASGANQVIGMRKALVFCERKRSNETNTRWFLHQFRLVGSAESLYPTQMLSRERLGEWSVFKAIQRKRKAKKHGSGRNQTSSAVHMASCIDFTVEDSSVFGLPPQPSSPSSSETTGVCTNGLLDEKISSLSHCCTRKQ